LRPCKKNGGKEMAKEKEEIGMNDINRVFEATGKLYTFFEQNGVSVNDAAMSMLLGYAFLSLISEVELSKQIRMLRIANKVCMGMINNSK
jgi:hypothetical protein